MKVVILIAQILLGLTFVVFGLNGFFNFIPMKGMPPGTAGQFLTAMFQSHYLLGVCTVQILGGLPLLVNRYVPLGLTLLGPLLVNILFYHAFMFHDGASIAILATLLWFLIFYHYRRHFAGLFVQRA